MNQFFQRRDPGDDHRPSTLPVIIPIAFAPQEKGVTNLDPCLFTTPAGLLVGNTGGAAFWIISWPELEGFQVAGKTTNASK
jgi:hypothetical protein